MLFYYTSRFWFHNTVMQSKNTDGGGIMSNMFDSMWKSKEHIMKGLLFSNIVGSLYKRGFWFFHAVNSNLPPSFPPPSLILIFRFLSRFVTHCLSTPSRFVTIYRGPSHTYKVQRLTESSSYSFRIQAISDAGEGPFSDTHTFCTTKSVPPALKGQLNWAKCVFWYMIKRRGLTSLLQSCIGSHLLFGNLSFAHIVIL